MWEVSRLVRGLRGKFRLDELHPPANNSKQAGSHFRQAEILAGRDTNGKTQAKGFQIF